MSTATQEWIETDLDRLEQQKQRYELALRSATSPAVRERHRRNVERLEEEIAGRREALRAVVPPPTSIEIDAPLVDVTGRFAKLIDRDPALQLRRTVAIAIGVAFLVGFVIVALLR